MNDYLAEARRIIEAARPDGWVLEPDAKRLFGLAGFAVPRFGVARSAEEAVRLADGIGYPVVAKVVSSRVLHKSDVAGVVVNIAAADGLEAAFRRLQALDGFSGMLVEEMVSGVELILGAKIDFQFGPMILLGMGGTGVEIYRDIALRMAPLAESDVSAMIDSLKARPLLEGYRGAEKVDRKTLLETVLAFSALFLKLSSGIASIDINPLLCSSRRCVVADARIVLGK